MAHQDALPEPWASLPPGEYLAWLEAFVRAIAPPDDAPQAREPEPDYPVAPGGPAAARPASPARADGAPAVAPAGGASRGAPAAERPPERLVQLIWAEQHLVPGPHATERGRTLEVIHPGRWNGGPGPDFRGAELRLDGHAVRGDVEVHVAAGEWRRHRHDEDFDYNGVVLHVVLDNDDGARTDRLQNGDKIERLRLRDRVWPDLDTLARSLAPEEHVPGGEEASDLGPCHALVAAIDTPALERFLDLAAGERLADKVRRLEAIGGDDLDQLVYQSLLTYLGQGPSKPLFYLLARRLPWRDLRLLLGDLEPARRPEAATALLLATASLLPTREEVEAAWDAAARKARPRAAASAGDGNAARDAAPDAAAAGGDGALDAAVGPARDEAVLAYLDRAAAWWRQARPYLEDRVLPPTRRWNAGVRPINFAPRLLAGFAHAVLRLERARAGGLADAVVGLFPAGATGASWKASERRGLIRATEAACEVDEPRDFWARRYTFVAAPAPTPMKLIGPQRAGLLAFNALLPCAVLLARRRGLRPLEALLDRLYRAWPPLQDNAVSRFMTWRLFAGEARARTLLRSEARRQALHQIYRDCCDAEAPGGAACAWFGGPLRRPPEDDAPAPGAPPARG